MRLRCFKCGKSISTEVPHDTVIRASMECPECFDITMDIIRKEIEQEIRFKGEEKMEEQAKDQVKMPAEIAKYEYVKYDEQSLSLCDSVKSHFHVIELMLNNLKPSRELSLARTKLEEAFMWIGKSIRQDQLVRTSNQPE